MGRFFAELRRRKVWLVAGVYAVTAWLLAQALALIINTYGAPGWVQPTLIAVLIAGFPVAVVLAWAFEMTPEGVQRTAGKDDDDPEEEAGAAERPSLDPKAIAVLPLHNLSPDPDNAYFAAGIHEEILGQLSKIAELTVIARTSVLQYETAPKPVPEIARELSVGTVMEGSVRFEGDTVRVTVQLIDAATNGHLWSENYDRDLESIFEIQSDVARRIAAALKVRLTADETARIDSVPTENLEAYQTYLKALEQVGLMDNAGALRLAQRATELDPEFADAYGLQGIMQGSLMLDPTPEDPRWRRDEVRRLADKALSLDPDSSRGHGARVTALAADFDWAGALEELDAYIASDTSNQRALAMGTTLLLGLGRVEDALSYVERAYRLAPADPSALNRKVKVLVHMGRLEEAVALGEQIVRLRPHQLFGLRELARAYFAVGNLSAAADTMERAANERKDQFTLDRCYLAFILGQSGRNEEAAAIKEEMDRQLEKVWLPAVYEFYVLAGIGEEERAIDAMERWVDTGCFWFIESLTDPMNPYQDRPRYKALLERAGLPQ